MQYFLILVFVLTLCFPKTIHAQSQSFSFSLTPTELELITSKNKTIPLTYTLTNTGDPTVIMIKAYRFEITDSQGNYTLLPYDTSLLDFPTISPVGSEPGSIRDGQSILLEKPILVNSQEAIEFDLEVTVGLNVSERDFYIALVVESVPSGGFTDANYIVLQGGVGSLLYISVSEEGTRIQKGSVSLFDVKSPYSFTLGNSTYRLFDSYQNIPLIVRVANQGDRLFRSSGQLLMTHFGASSPQNIVLKELTIPSGSERNLVPIDNKKYVIQENDGAIILPGSIAGVTTIHAFIQIGDESSRRTPAITYITFPFRATLVMMGAFCTSLIGLLLIRYVKQRRR